MRMTRFDESSDLAAVASEPEWIDAEEALLSASAERFSRNLRVTLDWWEQP